ncbi:anthranilate phosphoribosyltransferase [Rugamonas sp. CCM 8940]|uniref:anthranilate phosphoribosyltransferase n=1 Tax=Rugamonas sp. CCM 8940 TaxID=2765359 RepID=UPI0018F2A31C|nr:anthranilate phosphoribosyltransferase [Rugamonas sp. CCM 8940]MBJ7311262.1 anthranilate phosphoribosyltransferase [Rugamonas sp. CCM 8940]
MSITAQQALQRAVAGHDLPHEEMVCLMRAIMGAEVATDMVAALLIAWRAKPESIAEISAAAQVMREFCVPVRGPRDARHFVDLVGTGGDASHSFNISTTAMLVSAAAGAVVAKHGNRSVSSNSGSADVLEALGVNLMLDPAQVGACIAHTGIGFMYTPNHHPAMKRLAPLRRALGLRTLFNILGPLSNPAAAPNQLLGVFRPDLVGTLARVMQRLGSRHVLVVHGRDGMDEISLSAPTMVAELHDGRISEYEIAPEQFGLARADSACLRVDCALQSRQILLEVLANRPGAARDIVILNSAAALYAANLAPSIGDGIGMAREAIASGAALRRLEMLRAFSVACAAPEQLRA